MGVRVRQKTKGKGNPWWVFISHNGKGLIERWAIRKQPRPSPVESGKARIGELGFEEKKPAPSFKEHVKIWISLPHDWKESTRESYLENLNNHILTNNTKTRCLEERETYFRFCICRNKE